MLYFYVNGELKYGEVKNIDELNQFKTEGEVVGTEPIHGRRDCPEQSLFRLPEDQDAKITNLERYWTGHVHMNWSATLNIYKPKFPRINKLINALQNLYCSGNVDLSLYDNDSITGEERELLEKLLSALELEICPIYSFMLFNGITSLAEKNSEVLSKHGKIKGNKAMALLLKSEE